MINRDIKSIAILQTHLGNLLFSINELLERELMVKNGQLGNCEETKQRIRAIKQAIVDLAKDMQYR